MKSNFICLMLCVAFWAACSDKAITTATLLEEITARDNLAKFPAPYYNCAQFSSYDRVSVAPDKPGWYANWDRSEFIRTEENSGRREFVMFDAEGPGAIVRFWVTVASYGGNGILRFYIDNNEEPEIEGEVLKLLSGGGLVDEGPLAASVSELTPYLQRGHNLYFPIPYAKHCKITYESASIVKPGPESGENFYYNINYRTYDKGTKVVSFTQNDIRQNQQLIKNVQEKLAASAFDNRNLSTENIGGKIKAGSEQSYKIEGRKAIKKLTLKLNAPQIEQALRSTVLEISFDGERTVWCPAGDFFGAGYKISPFKTYYTEAAGDGTLTSYWVMPFEKECAVKIINLGEQDVEVLGSIMYGDWKWDRRSMHFGASWYQQTNLDTGEKRNMEGTGDQFDVNYVTLSGQGVLVGTGVVLFNTVSAWWGEGDEKVYVDGEKFPSHFGTGTEDYYGYAWCMSNPFSHPFIAQPDGSGDNDPGYVSNIRYRGLDAIPFSQSLRFDLEMWHWQHTQINHAPAAFWYARPGVKSNIAPKPEDAKRKVALKKSDIIPPIVHEAGIVEGENMEAHKTAGNTSVQNMSNVGWSRNSQMWWRDGKPGDELELSFLMKDGGVFDMSAVFTLSHDYGIISVELNEKPVLAKYDTYHPTVISKEVKLGKQTVLQGENILKIKILDKNPKSTRYFFGLDRIELK